MISNLAFLGFVLTFTTIKVENEKIKAIQEWTTPWIGLFLLLIH
jgi:hypothetical protein